jgi:hypothetical protein
VRQQGGQLGLATGRNKVEHGGIGANAGGLDVGQRSILSAENKRQKTSTAAKRAGAREE